LFAALPLWEAWAVATQGSIAPAHCSGMFAGSLCAAGLWLGRVLFGSAQAHFGYVILSAALGAVVVYIAWGLDRRFRAKSHAHGDA